jgi:hypothetical protein
MYNFSIPSASKEWIDNIARAGRTLRYSASDAIGLLTGKKDFVVKAGGGAHPGRSVSKRSIYAQYSALLASSCAPSSIWKSKGSAAGRAHAPRPVCALFRLVVEAKLGAERTLF